MVILLSIGMAVLWLQTGSAQNPNAPGQSKPTPQPGGPAVKEGERFGVIHVGVRQNYVVPEAITVEEGWYRVVVDDPSRVASGAEASLQNEAGAAVAAKGLAALSSRTSFYVRIGPGKHRLKLGNKAEWVVQVTATAAPKR